MTILVTVRFMVLVVALLVISHFMAFRFGRRAAVRKVWKRMHGAGSRLTEKDIS